MHQLSFSSLSRIRTVLHAYSKIIMKEKEKKSCLATYLSSKSGILRLLRYSSIAPRCAATQAFGRGAPWTRVSLTQLGVGVGVSNTRIDTDTDTDHRHRTRRRTHLDFYSYVPHGTRSQCQSVHTVLTSPGPGLVHLQPTACAAHLRTDVRYAQLGPGHCTALHYTAS